MIRLAAASRDACDTPPNSTKVCAAKRRNGSLNVLYPFCATASVWRATPPASPLDTFSKWPVLVMVSSKSIAPRPCLSIPKPNCSAKSCKPSSSKPSLVSNISSCLDISFASFDSCFAVRAGINLSSSICWPSLLMVSWLALDPSDARFSNFRLIFFDVPVTRPMYCIGCVIKLGSSLKAIRICASSELRTTYPPVAKANGFHN